jgi:ferrochelatase
MAETQTSRPTRIGVLLFNLGGPETLDDVYPFLLNLFSDPDIFRVPKLVQPLIARLVARKRAPKSREYYRQIGGGSPLRKITDEQARLLEEALNAGTGDGSFRVRAGMRYAEPRTQYAVRDLLSFSADTLVLLPLYPQRSRTTTGSSFREAHAILADTAPSIPVVSIPAYPDYPPYIEALADTILEGLSGIPETEPVHLIFSAHGIPQFLVDREKDPYQADTERTFAAVMKRLGDACPDRRLTSTLSYQSRVGPLKWLGPETRSELARLAGSGKDNILMVPVSFVSDHQETLYEMDILYAKMAGELGIRRFVRVPSLNTRPSFIHALASLVRDALSSIRPYSADCPCRCGVCPQTSNDFV